MREIRVNNPSIDYIKIDILAKQIIVATIKEIVGTVKKQMFDELFHLRILEKIKPTRRYSTSDASVNNGGKSSNLDLSGKNKSIPQNTLPTNKAGAFNTNEKKRIIADLTSTQCRKRTISDSFESYTSYLAQIVEYYTLFHNAAP
jgi:hypothetical protein